MVHHHAVLLVAEAVGVEHKDKMKIKKMFLLLSLSLVFVFFIILITGCGNNTTGNAISNEEYVKVPLSDLSKEAQFYTYGFGNAEMNYFAVIGSDNKVRTAFDACDVCGGSKGYQQTGNDITCRKCERVFSIDGLGTKNKGYGCWPSFLSHKIEGDNVLIKIDDIKNGIHRFK